MMDHRMRDHHVSMEASMFGVTSSDSCLCGAAPSDPVHSAPPCDWCEDSAEIGPPAPWWHRLWCRFAYWWLIGKKKD